MQSCSRATQRPMWRPKADEVWAADDDAEADAELLICEADGEDAELLAWGALDDADTDDEWATDDAELLAADEPAWEADAEVDEEWAAEDDAEFLLLAELLFAHLALQLFARPPWPRRPLPWHVTCIEQPRRHTHARPPHPPASLTRRSASARRGAPIALPPADHLPGILSARLQSGDIYGDAYPDYDAVLTFRSTPLAALLALAANTPRRPCRSPVRRACQTLERDQSQASPVLLWSSPPTLLACRRREDGTRTTILSADPRTPYRDGDASFQTLIRTSKDNSTPTVEKNDGGKLIGSKRRISELTYTIAITVYNGLIMNSVNRLTLTPLYLQYLWRSRPFIQNTWISEPPLNGLETFTETLRKLDTESLPPDTDQFNVIYRAYLGLPTISEHRLPDEDACTSNAAYACWITFLRFQSLDLLISLAEGVSEAHSAPQSAPNSEKALGLLKALANWPSRLDSMEKTLKQKAKSNVTVTFDVYPPECKSTELIQVLLSTKWESTQLGKAQKNIQAAAAALKWIIERGDHHAKITGSTKVANTYVGLPEDERREIGSLTVQELLRPLAYILNSSSVVAFCSLDLGKPHGHMISQYQHLLFPKVAHSSPPGHEDSNPGEVAVVGGDPASTGRNQIADEGHELEISTTSQGCPRDNNAISNPPPPNIQVTSNDDETISTITEIPLMLVEPEKAQGCPRDNNAISNPPPPPNIQVTSNDDQTISTTTEIPLMLVEPEKARLISRPPTWPTNEYVSGFLDSLSHSASSELDDTQNNDVSKKRKDRKASGPRKKRKVEVSDTFHAVEMDPPETSNTPVIMEAYRPDGFSKRSFPLRLHALSDHAERPMLLRLQESMNALDKQCLKNGRRFRHHLPGCIPTMPPADDEFDLYVIENDDWQGLSPSERVLLWGTGCDIFISKMRVPNQNVDIVERISTLHGLDTPIEVQVPGLRIPASDTPTSDGNPKETYYTDIIRMTTLRNFLKHASSSSGVVLNALSLPATHTASANPLAGRLATFSGLDLEDIAYRQTNGSHGFPRENVPSDQRCWQIAGTPHTLTLPHMDMAATYVTPEGPGEKLWIRKRRSGSGSENAHAFHTWDPDKPSGTYEGVVLPPHGGTLLMQPTTEHIVVGLTPAPGSTADPSNSKADHENAFMGTLVTGGHFVAASTIRASLYTLLHLVMMENILTNVAHDGLWQVFARISAFWLSVTSERPHDCHTFQAYIPQLSTTTTKGWLDIVCVSTVVVLATPFDRRHYTRNVSPSELKQRQTVCEMYRNWRQWFAKTFAGTYDGVPVDWEQDLFTPVLMHLAIVLTLYHRREEDGESNDVLLSRKNKELAADVSKTLNKYMKGLGDQFLEKLERGPPEAECSGSNFFLFEGAEFQLT
ncbi:hypothetical protein K438DRAFT_1786940 [Mycena galopus ATCC 62051]|nr:hypothetical protein K438DRAFT_1786940 [Mycena galopus ATCC 62051]